MAGDGAPGDLELVREFVNTLEVDDGTDHLTDPAALAGWLCERGLMRGRAADEGDLARARRLREGLRALMLENNGVSVGKEARAVLDRTARRAGLGVRFHPDRASLEPTAVGADGALGRLVAAAAGAMLDGTWARLKACRAPDCRWAFYDQARNHSRTWCSMAVCGNRVKARTYRRRHAGRPRA
jgi:predicted RNA-binding Zn ribbon-like protein